MGHFKKKLQGGKVKYTYIAKGQGVKVYLPKNY
jgi:hypothetical protein